MIRHGSVLQAYLNGDEEQLNDIIERSAEFRHLTEHPAYVRLKAVVDGMYHSAAELALDEPERAEFFKGVREGIRILHKLLQDSVDDYEAAQRALVEMRDEPSYDREPIEPTPLMFGQSSL